MILQMLRFGVPSLLVHKSHAMCKDFISRLFLNCRTVPSSLLVQSDGKPSSYHHTTLLADSAHLLKDCD